MVQRLEIPLVIVMLLTNPSMGKEEPLIQNAMDMKSDKSYKSGQVTSKTEIGVCLARGLQRMITDSKSNKKAGNVTMVPIAEQYKKWCQDHPKANKDILFETVADKETIEKMRDQAWKNNADKKKEKRRKQ